MKMFRSILFAAVTALAAIPAFPCSRVVLRGDSTDVVMIGRTLDWRTPIPTNIYVYPAGMKKESMPEGPRLTWTSKYGSVLAVGYDGGVTEGMNDRGLVMNGLFCKKSIYKEAVAGSDMPVMSLAVIVSYFLDNFASVAEVKDWLANNEFGISGKTFDGGTVSLLHWAFTDLTGTTLIMEYDNANLNIYDSPSYQVLTNDPTFVKMQAINDYWQQVGGNNFLPGGVRSPERFVRADYFVHHVPVDGITSDQALPELISIMANVSVPFKYEVPGQPELSSTQWMSVSDLNRKRYFFKFADSLGTFYVDLSTLLLTPGSPVLKLDTSDHSDFFGCVNHRLKKSAPFTPMW